MKFSKFVSRLRNKFSVLFDDTLRVQLILKKVCTEDEWNEFKEEIWYDFLKDNNFDELKEAELLQNRISILQSVDPFVGRYYSMEWIKKNVLQMDDDEIKEIQKQIEEERDSYMPGTPGGPPGEDQSAMMQPPMQPEPEQPPEEIPGQEKDFAPYDLPSSTANT